eukprot:15332687-Ditylum_brightwellii.AAC.1
MKKAHCPITITISKERATRINNHISNATRKSEENKITRHLIHGDDTCLSVITSLVSKVVISSPASNEESVANSIAALGEINAIINNGPPCAVSAKQNTISDIISISEKDQSNDDSS